MSDALEWYRALGPGLCNRQLILQAQERVDGRYLLENKATESFRRSVSSAKESRKIARLVKKARAGELVNEATLDWANSYLGTVIAEEDRKRRETEIKQAEQKKAAEVAKAKVAAAEAAARLERKNHLRRVLKYKQVALTKLIGSQQREATSRLEDEALLRDAAQAREDLNELAELEAEEEAQDEVDARVRAQELEELQSRIAQAEAEALLEKKNRTTYEVTLTMSSEGRRSKQQAELVLTICGDNGESEPTKLTAVNLWGSNAVWKLKVKAARPLGNLLRCLVDDDCLGSIAVARKLNYHANALRSPSY